MKDLPGLPDHLKGFDVEQFFDPDSPSGEPVLNQVHDPFNGGVYGPLMEVDENGTVTFLD